MPLLLSCPKCQTRMRVADTCQPGTRVACPSCKTVLATPAPRAPAPVVPTASPPPPPPPLPPPEPPAAVRSQPPPLTAPPVPLPAPEVVPLPNGDDDPRSRGPR